MLATRILREPFSQIAEIAAKYQQLTYICWQDLRMTSDAPKASLKSARARSIFFCTPSFAFLSSHCDLVSFVTGSARCPDHKRFAPRPEPAVCGNTNLWQSKLIKTSFPRNRDPPYRSSLPDGLVLPTFLTHGPADYFQSPPARRLPQISAPK